MLCTCHSLLAPSYLPHGSQEWAAAKAKREVIRAALLELLGGDAVLVVPTAPGPAPLIGTPAPALDEWRKRMISLTCVAGLAGLPQVTLPVASVEGGLPVGLSLMGPPGSDEQLLALSEQLAVAVRPELA